MTYRHKLSHGPSSNHLSPPRLSSTVGGVSWSWKLFPVPRRLTTNDFLVKCRCMPTRSAKRIQWVSCPAVGSILDISFPSIRCKRNVERHHGQPSGDKI